MASSTSASDDEVEEERDEDSPRRLPTMMRAINTTSRPHRHYYLPASTHPTAARAASGGGGDTDADAEDAAAAMEAVLVSSEYSQGDEQATQTVVAPPSQEATPTSTTHSVSTSPSSCSYTADGLLLLLKQVRCNDPSLQQIVLDPRRRGGHGGIKRSLPPAYMRALLEALAKNVHVQRVRLFRMTCGDDGSGVPASTLLARVLRQNRVLTDLHLTKCTGGTSLATQEEDSSHAGWCAVADALREQTTLRRLVLEAMGLTDAVVVALCDAIAHNPHCPLQVLKLGRHPQWGAPAWEALARLLRRPDCPLRKLDLRGCQLGKSRSSSMDNNNNNNGAAAAVAGITTLAQALAVNTSLQSLCLGRNELTDGTLQDIVAALRTNRHLQTLDLSYNPLLTDTGAEALARCLEESTGGNNSCLRVKLRHCSGVSDAMKERLLELLLVHAHGPVLAQKTKQALRSLLLLLQMEEEDASESSSSSNSRFQDSSNSSSVDRDGGHEGVIRETSTSANNVTQNLADCVICFDQPAAVALLPCKHRNCCTACAEKLKTCHMCRETIVKVFPLVSLSSSAASSVSSRRR